MPSVSLQDPERGSWNTDSSCHLSLLGKTHLAMQAVTAIGFCLFRWEEGSAEEKGRNNLGSITVRQASRK